MLYSCTASPPPIFSPSPPVRESSTHEQPFLISHTFEKCQKCFMRLVSAQLVQSDVRTGLIKATGRGAKGSEGRRCVPWGLYLVRQMNLQSASATAPAAWKETLMSFSEKSDDRTEISPPLRTRPPELQLPDSP